MNYKGFPIGVHLNENSVKVLEGIVQHDNGNLFQIQLYDGTDAFDFTGYSLINAVLIRPDETTLADIWSADIEETEEEETESHTFLAIQYLDAKNGRITLKVGGEATEQVGLHRMAIEIYSDGVLLTTARINYNVVRSLNEMPQSILQNSEGYAALQNLLAQVATIVESERERSNQEMIRQEQETERQTRVIGLVQELTEFVSTIRADLEIAQAAAEDSKAWARTAQALVTEDLPQALQDAINNAAASAATINDLTGRIGVLESKTTRLNLNNEEGFLNVPVVTSSTIAAYFTANNAPGAVVFNSTDGALYVGRGSGNYVVVKDPDAFPGYIRTYTEPEDTDYLWIDAGDGNQMKFYHNDEWVPVKSIAVFG